MSITWYNVESISRWQFSTTITLACDTGAATLMYLGAGATQGWGACTTGAACTTGEACTTGDTHGCAIWDASNSLFHMIGISRLDNTSVTWSYFPAEYVHSYLVDGKEIEQAFVVPMTLINQRWCFEKWRVISQTKRIAKSRMRITADVETFTKTRERLRKNLLLDRHKK